MDEKYPGGEERRQKVEKFAQRIPAMWRDSYLRVCAGKASKSDMKRVRCLTCVNFEDSRNTIRECRVLICDNWAFRPFQEKR